LPDISRARDSVFAALAILTLIIIAVVGFTIVKLIESGDSSMLVAISIMIIGLAVVIILGFYILGLVSIALG
jgi:hypothetical protein